MKMVAHEQTLRELLITTDKNARAEFLNQLLDFSNKQKLLFNKTVNDTQEHLLKQMKGLNTECQTHIQRLSSSIAALDKKIIQETKELLEKKHSAHIQEAKELLIKQMAEHEEKERRAMQTMKEFLLKELDAKGIKAQQTRMDVRVTALEANAKAGIQVQ